VAIESWSFTSLRVNPDGLPGGRSTNSTVQGWRRQGQATLDLPQNYQFFAFLYGQSKIHWKSVKHFLRNFWDALAAMFGCCETIEQYESTTMPGTASMVMTRQPE
jgi:hypothetical protein